MKIIHGVFYYPCLLCGSRGADQVIEGTQRRFGTLAHRNHDLFVRHGSHVTGAEHTVPLSQSVLGSKPICSKIPSSSTVRSSSV